MVEQKIKPMKDVSVVIVNYKMKDVLVACLKSLYLDISKSDLDISVVVVDNNSEDGLRHALMRDFPGVLCVELGENVGFGAAQNRGIEAVLARYYFILNPDTYFNPKKKTVQPLFNFMEKHRKVGVIGPKVLYPDGTLQYSCWRFPTFLQPFFSRTFLGEKGLGRRCSSTYFMKDFNHLHTIPVDAVMGSALFVRRDALKEVGGFDERYFMYFEDIDWCRRFWEAGWPVYYVHDIVLTHIHGRGSAKVAGFFSALIKNKLTRDHIRSWLRYTWKWYGNKKFYG